MKGHRFWLWRCPLRQQVPALARQFRVIRYDIRPFGQSSPVTQPYAPIDDLRAILDRFGVRRAHLIGHSFGGNVAIDFMLLVGEAGGTGDKEPHVYMFQSKAQEANLTPGGKDGLKSIVAGLQAQLDVLFGASHASTHVLRLAGIHSARQVTLCVAAINLGGNDLKALGAPFNIVLFDSADFRAQGGAAFPDTQFFRDMLELEKK